MLERLFTKKTSPIRDFSDFWRWFQENERSFFRTVKRQKNIEKDFFDKLLPKLNELKEGFFFLTGMLNDHTAELIFTADGDVKNIVFVEELVMAAPAMAEWKFTALKPPLSIENVRIDMGGYSFDSDTLSFHPNEDKDHPDEIDITIVHSEYDEGDRSTITNGVYIFLDNFLGELNAVTTIDNIAIIGREQAEKELIPIAKLKEFLVWREKEFVEKYEGTMQDSGSDEFAVLEAELESGNKLIATVNTDVLNWDKKASHPWIATLEVQYNGRSETGMPDDATYDLLNGIEEKALLALRDVDGFVYIGRQTAKNVREVYFACKDFRKPSKVLHQLTLEYPDTEMAYDIYKDKYWRSFDRFKRNYD